MKPFIIIQLRPENETADNEYSAILKFGGLKTYQTIRIRAEQTGVPDFSLDEYSGIIVGGSPFDISTPLANKTSLQLEIEESFKKLFDVVVARDFPFLGACSGNGLLGSYCGATISKCYGEPVGGVDITITPEGKHDPLLEGLPSPFRALVGHKEACDRTPPGATLLASSATCPVQMFRVGKNVYATQFHPEGDTEGFTLRIAIYKHHGYFPPESAEQLVSAIANEDVRHANTILHRFVTRYRQ